MRVIACVGLAVITLVSAPNLANAQGENEEGQPITRPSVQVGVPAGAPQAAPARPQRPKAPSKPTPRCPDGKPILGRAPGEKTGTWGSCCGSLANAKTPFQPWAKAVFAYRNDNQFEPHTRCHPRAERVSSSRRTGASGSSSPS